MGGCQGGWVVAMMDGWLPRWMDGCYVEEGML